MHVIVALKSGRICLFAVLLLLIPLFFSAPVNGSKQTLTLQYSVDKGDTLIFKVTKADAGFTYLPYKKGDYILVNVLQNLSSVEGEYDDSVVTYYRINDTRDLFRTTYPDQTENTSRISMYVYPVQGVLGNGTTLSLVDFVSIDAAIHNDLVTVQQGVVKWSFQYVYFGSYSYNLTTGILISYTITDPNFNGMTIERVDSIEPTNSTPPSASSPTSTKNKLNYYIMASVASVALLSTIKYRKTHI